MYNCAFGDCFRITKSDAPNRHESVLFVDFGIHKLCKRNSNEPTNWRSQRYQAIVDDILGTYPLNTPHNNVDFLLSHYHYDHYSGLDYLPNNWKFDNVYIPDVWNDEIDIAKRLVKANAINLGAGSYSVYFHDSIDSIRKEIL